MTPTGPRTATELLFGPGASAAAALTAQLLSAEGEASLDQALQGLAPATRQAAARETAASAAGLLDIDLAELLVAGWRTHRDLTGAARRTLAAPGSTELVDLIRHRVTTAQQPSVTVLVNGQQVATIQLRLTVEFDISALVAGIRAGLLVAIHSGSCEVTAALTVQETDVLTASTHYDLPGTLAVSPGIRLLPAADYPAGGQSGQPAAALLRADVVVVLLDHVHGRFLRGRCAAVDPHVAGDQVLLLVRMGAFVLGHQPAGPRIRAVVEQQAVHVLVPGVVVLVEVLDVLGHFVVFVVEVEGVVRLLLGQQLVQGLTFALLGGGVAVPDPGRPPLRRNDAPVQGIVAWCPEQRVGRVLDLIVLEVLGLMAGLVWHCQLLSGPSRARPGPVSGSSRARFGLGSGSSRAPLRRWRAGRRRPPGPGRSCRTRRRWPGTRPGRPSPRAGPSGPSGRPL